jgi:CHAD domain-containing protein
VFAENMKKYYQLHVRSMRNYCRRAVKNRQAEDIHQMRVENKRLRGLFRLAGEINPGFDQKMYFTPYKEINSRCSVLRDAHVQLDLLDIMKKNLDARLDGFRLYLLKQELQGWNTFLEFAGDGSLRQLRMPSIKLNQAMASTAETRGIDGARQRVREMNGHLLRLHDTGSIDQSVMHDVRTLSKELYFTILIIQQCFELFLDEKTYIDALCGVHKALGKWHDYDVCMGLLDDFLVSAGNHVPLADYYRLKELADTRRFKHHRTFETAFSAFIPLAQRL